MPARSIAMNIVMNIEQFSFLAVNIEHWPLKIEHCRTWLLQAERYFLFLHNSICNLTLHSTSFNNYNYNYRMFCKNFLCTGQCAEVYCSILQYTAVLVQWSVNCMIILWISAFGICIWVCICICVVFAFEFMLYLHLYLCCIAVLALEFGSAPLVGAPVKFQAGTKWPLGLSLIHISEPTRPY